MTPVNAQMWWLALGVGLVIVLVVAVLLQLIVSTARRIRGTLEAIWVAGPMIANNTAHIDLVRRIDLVAGRIPEVAGRIVGHTSRIQEHANGCAGCPRCVVGWSR